MDDFNYRSVIVWQKSSDFVKRVYGLVKLFPAEICALRSGAPCGNFRSEQHCRRRWPCGKSRLRTLPGYC